MLCSFLHSNFDSYLMYDKLTLNLNLQADVKGQECKLQEPIYGTQFDLNKLHSELGLKVGGNGKDIIEFNVCNGNLTKVCAGAKSAACLTRNGKQYKFGNTIVL